MENGPGCGYAGAMAIGRVACSARAARSPGSLVRTAGQMQYWRRRRRCWRLRRAPAPGQSQDTSVTGILREGWRHPRTWQCPGRRKAAWFHVVADIGLVAGAPDAGGVIEFLRNG